MNCPKCGLELEMETAFCPNCGCSLSVPEQDLTVQAQRPEAGYRSQPQSEPQPQAQYQYQPQPGYQQQYQPRQQAVYVNSYYSREPEIPPQYRLMGPWSYFGLALLFSVPIVGFIFLIVFSFNDNNLNRRNYARSYWCGLLIGLIVLTVILIVLLITGTLYDVLYDIF